VTVIVPLSMSRHFIDSGRLALHYFELLKRSCNPTDIISGSRLLRKLVSRN